MSKDNPRPVEAAQDMDDAFQSTRIETLLETLVEQNDEIIQLLKVCMIKVNGKFVP